jgi:hypothetical protein
MTKVGFKPLTGKMAQRDEGLPVAPPVIENIALYLSIPARVAVFVAEAAKDLSGSVPLLDRRGLIVGEDLVNDRLERTELRRVAFPNRGNRLGMCKGLPDRDPGETELAGNLPD